MALSLALAETLDEPGIRVAALNNLALAYGASNDITGALDRLLTAVPLTAGDDRERVRTRLLEFFDLLGPDDPRVPPARRELARALF